MTARSALLTLAVSSTLLSGYDALAPPATPALGRTSQLSRPRAAVIIGHPSRPRCLGGDDQSCLARASSWRKDTALPMGMRSFIKRKVKKLRKRGEDGKEEDISLHSILPSPGSAGLMESPLSTFGHASDDGITDDEGDKNPNKNNASKAKKIEKYNGREYFNKIFNKDTVEKTMYYEGTQDRILRMKRGGMTEEEKVAFLNNALTRTLPKQKATRPPIRQKIPGMQDADVDGKDKKELSKKKSGGIPGKENLWNAITRKSGSIKDKVKSEGGPSMDISVASLMMNGKMKSEDAKRRYMESITKPARFATFTTYQHHTSAFNTEEGHDGDKATEDKAEDDVGNMEGALAEEKEEDEPENTVSSVQTNFAQMKRQIVEDREFLNHKGNQESNDTRDAVESILSMISSNNEKKKAASPLAQNTTTTRGNTMSSTDHLAARLGVAAEAQEKRDAEARLMNEKKRQEEKRVWAEAQKQLEEDLRRREVERMEKARQIAEEERRREEEKVAAKRAELEARQAKQDEFWAKMLEKERARKVKRECTGVTWKKEVIAPARVCDGKRATENPHEAEIFKEASEAKFRDHERVREIEIQSASSTSHIVPKQSNENISVSAFIQEQQRKKEQVDRLRKLDEQSLKSLNSPLPSPAQINRPVVLAPPIPLPSVDARPPLGPAPAQSSPLDLSMASLTMAKKREKGETAPTPTSSPPSPQPLNLAELTKLKQDCNPPPSSTVARPTSIKKKQPKRVVVRQQLPLSTRTILGDDDNDLMSPGAPGLTVADALQERKKNEGSIGVTSPPGKKNLSADEKAKQWGIDMSKFK